MKNLFFSLVFMLAGLSAFATNIKMDKILDVKLNDTTTVIVSAPEVESCKVKIKKKNKDGTWEEYEVEIKDTTCDKLVVNIIKGL